MSKLSDLIENAEAAAQSKISDPTTKAILSDTFTQLKTDVTAIGADAVIGAEGVAEGAADAALTGAVGPAIAPVVEVPLHNLLAVGFSYLLSLVGVHPSTTVTVPTTPTVTAAH